MSISREEKQGIIQTFAISEKDTGSSEVQVAVLTKSISHLSDHMKLHPKDLHSRRGLMRQLSLRRRHLDYLKKAKPTIYKEIVAKLELRK